ncbi:hypothetical protein D1872_354310 [compost metagenome]
MFAQVFDVDAQCRIGGYLVIFPDILGQLFGRYDAVGVVVEVVQDLCLFLGEGNRIAFDRE